MASRVGSGLTAHFQHDGGMDVPTTVLHFIGIAIQPNELNLINAGYMCLHIPKGLVASSIFKIKSL